MFYHGFRRYTEIIEFLVTPDSLRTIREKLVEPYYIADAKNGQHMRDCISGVRIIFRLMGAYPGNDENELVAFPDPARESIKMDGIRVLPLPRLMELKLGAGIANPHRMRHLADAQELIDILHMPEDFDGQLHSSVRAMYQQVWGEVANAVYPDGWEKP